MGGGYQNQVLTPNAQHIREHVGPWGWVRSQCQVETGWPTSVLTCHTSPSPSPSARQGRTAAPGTGLQGAAAHLASRVKDHIQEAVHRQAEAPVDTPDRLLTLQRALGAQEEALAHVAADLGHGGQLGARRQGRIQLG